MSNPQRYPNGLSNERIAAYSFRLNSVIEYVHRAAAAAGVPASAIFAIIYHESKGRPNLVNPTSGAFGYMQVLPRVYRSLGYTDESIREGNAQIAAGVEVFARGYRKYGGDLALAFAAYGAGARYANMWRDAGRPEDWEVGQMTLGFLELNEAMKRETEDDRGALWNSANARRGPTRPDVADNDRATLLQQLRSMSSERSWFDTASELVMDFFQ